ncbi:DUF4158 domain-containing protein [Methylocystis sp. IM3]|uniref:DUF4158 domain-containing protein n=1 Tax=unclassified Methylocystis TaxID=2625913 RepID=UPI0030FBF41F
MKKHEILSSQARAALFDPPCDPTAIIRYYTFSPDDLALVRRRRRDANRLGFALHLAYQRFPGRVLGIDETPPEDVLSFIASQLSIEPGMFHEYARREETRWEHLGDIQSYLGVRPFSGDDYRYVAKIATTEATGTDRGDAIVAAMIEALRTRGILLPAATILERIGLAARARARKQAHKNLIEGLEQRTINELQALIAVSDDRDRTRLAWLRDGQEAPTQKNLVGIVERLQFVRSLGVGPDREQRIHRARYRTTAKETAILSA